MDSSAPGLSIGRLGRSAVLKRSSLSRLLLFRTQVGQFDRNGFTESAAR